MAKYTINDFRKQYGNDVVCLDKIFTLRYGNLTHCPACNEPAKFKRIITRRCYQCRHCYEQFYPTAGTVFEKTRISLADWFYVIYLFTATRNGVAAKEIERQLGVTYKTAWRIGHQVRNLMSGTPISMMQGFVEIDETYIGGKEDKKSKARRAANLKNHPSKNMGRATELKAPVLGIVQRNGEVFAQKMENVTKAEVFPVIAKVVGKDARVSTDEYPLYKNLATELGIAEHGFIRHALEQYRNGRISTNTIEGFFSQLKRTIRGTHISVSPDYLQNYLNECLL